jgi:hypothetical protein
MFYRAFSRLLVAILVVGAAGLWGVATARSAGPGEPTTVVVNPVTATNFVGQQHCVTATVYDGSVPPQPLPGVTVVFTVGPSVPSTFPTPSTDTEMTGLDGTTPPFCYTVSLPGVDTIRATAKSNVAAPTTLGSTSSTGNPFGEATKVWLPPVSTQLCEADITGGGWFVADDANRVNFGGNAMADSNSSPSGQEEFQDQPAQMNVHSIKVTAITCTDDRTAASIFGEATINGSGDHVFRIDVTDMGSPGVNDTYGITLDTGYVSGQHTLMGGNITIH